MGRWPRLILRCACMRPKTSHRTSSTRIAPTTAHLMAMPVCTGVSQIYLVEMGVDANGRIAPQAIVVIIIIDVIIHLSLLEHEIHGWIVFTEACISMKEALKGLCSHD